ncbi:MAG: glycosyltransferase family 1 protein [Candidatus Gastranaerophilaceae bacterium]
MKHIAINALGLKSNTGGVESYVYNNVKALLDNDLQNKYYLFIGKNVENIFNDLLVYKNLKIIIHPIDTNNSNIRVFWESTILSLELLKYKIDLAHHIGNYLPWICPVKSVVTIHDLVPFFYNEYYPEYKITQRFYNYFKTAVKYTVKKADKIIVISEFTKNELIKFFDIDKSKIEVIYQSLDSRKQKDTPDQSALGQYKIDKPYLLSVSVIRPHKNIVFLIKVFNLLKEKYNIPHQLVIAGGIHFGGEKFSEEINNSLYKEDIKYLGFVDNKDLASLYTYADIFLFPSLYEGFGIPLLEAMKVNLPIICSDISIFKEVCGKNGMYFNPSDEEDTCNKIFNLLSDNALKQNLIENSKNQLKKFCWDKIAESLIKVYEKF